MELYRYKAASRIMIILYGFLVQFCYVMGGRTLHLVMIVSGPLIRAVVASGRLKISLDSEGW